MNKRQLEVQKMLAENESEVLKQLKQVYIRASKDCDIKIRELSARTDMENMQSIIWQKQYQEALKKQIDSVLDRLGAESFTTVADYLAECYENNFFGTLYDLQGQGIPLIFPFSQEDAVQAIQIDSKISKGLYQRMGEDTDQLKKSIRSEISRGISNGSSWNMIAGEIAFGMSSPFMKAYTRAIGIVRTEGHRVQQESALHCQQRAREKGADVVKQWDSTLDNLTRPHHRELDGQVRETDEPFEVAGKKAMYPGGFGDPSEDCNCRCCLLQRARWALSEEEYYTKWDGDKNELVTVKARTYNEFKEKVREALKKQKSSEIMLGELEKAYGKKHSGGIRKQLQKAPEAARNLWNECAGDFHCIEPKYRGEKAFYSPSRDGVKLNIAKAAKGSGYQTPYQVVFHEYGHHCDYILNRRYGTGQEKKAFSETYKEGILGKTLKREADKAIENFAKGRINRKEIEERFDRMVMRGMAEASEKNSYVEQAMKNFVITDEIKKDFCEHIKKELSLIQRADISDMFEPVMPPACAYPFGIGHGASYWKNRDNGKEGFAEIYSAMVSNPESLEQIKLFFPESFNIFQEMLEVTD